MKPISTRKGMRKNAERMSRKWGRQQKEQAPLFPHVQEQRQYQDLLKKNVPEKFSLFPDDVC